MATRGASVPVGVLSLGDMGAGIARLLMARGFAVATNCQGRSQDTVDRAKDAGIEMLSSDLELVERCAVILSVVPPRDAEATARRVADALSGGPRKEPLYFVDLNAVSPSTCKGMAALFTKARVPVRFIDGCILGAPPRLRTATARAPDSLQNKDQDSEWRRPDIPVSGPDSLSSLGPQGDRLASVLNFRSISPDIGAASGLKMCFASIAKGFTALVTQSFTTAERLGVAGELKRELADILPNHLATAERSVPDMPPKAYRWVREMEEIADTMHEEGGWSKDMFRGVAGVYKAVADDEVLGKEKVGKRNRGTSLEDVAAAMAEGLERKRKKTE
ncbi:6-phosphogluconate dehydrogenase, NAD-binding protein [Purpureocillium lavendulum]|uniref:6-phosphogluconate dehydrogenase, NAD-binding protein n=1 Tax=Purpureocillium lavendulum TaxID=1247861 RepID=A0AB34G3V2_9HYPO|nr:6-phosphogluconate dehydrogenase, NAD-binding protein [Purpureocillium lavendulum]